MKEAPYSRPVHLDADKVLLWRRRGHCQQGIAHAEPDLKDALTLTPKGCLDVERTCAVLKPPFRPVPFIGALLPRGHAPGAQDETADRAIAWVIRHGER